MSIRLFDGFEAFPIMRNNATYGNCHAVVGRDGVGRGIQASNNSGSFLLAVTGVGFSSGILGVGFKSMTSSAELRLNSNGGTVIQLGIDVDGLGHPRLTRGSSAIATSTALVALEAWHYYELKFSIADAGGTAILKADGVEVLNFTGDTKNGGTGLIDSFQFAGRIGGVQVDDVYLLDLVDGTSIGQALPFNDWIGEKVIKAKRPVASGAVSDFLGSDGDSIDNYAHVDEDPISTTDYVSSNVPGARDLYQLNAATGLATVEAVQAMVYASKSDSGARSLKVLTRQDGSATIDDSGTLPLSTNWTSSQGAIETKNPDGVAWTPFNVNSIQAGYEVV